VTRDGVGAGNELGVEAAKALAPVLAKLTQLNSLNLDGMCRIRMQCASFVARRDAVTRDGVGAGNSLGVEGAKLLAQVLVKLTQLNSLNLDRMCRIRMQCASFVARRDVVTRDGVGAENGLGVEGAKLLAPVLVTLTQLNSLHLNGACRIRMQCASFVARRDAVTRDGVGAGNSLGVEGAKVLAPVLAKLTQLNSLNLGCAYRIRMQCASFVARRDAVTRDGVGAGNRLGVEGAKALAPVLATLTQLNLLSLERACRIGMQCA